MYDPLALDRYRLEQARLRRRAEEHRPHPVGERRSLPRLLRRHRGL